MLSILKQLRWPIAVITMLVASQVLGHGMSEAEKQSIIEGGNLRYMWIGATHMISGYDHLLFIFGIIFFLTRFKDIVKYITAFTLGHSITLIYATFTGIQVNYFLIDAVIALSVCYIAFSNLNGFKKYFNVNPPNLLIMILGLGLIHGLGLSTRLQQLPLMEDQLLMNIISFNVGIELGQISALAIMLLIISIWRKSSSFMTFSKLANYGLIIAGGLLFLMQMHGYEHNSNPEEFTAGSASEQSVVNSTVVTASTGANAAEKTTWKDTIDIVIPARGDKEYKVFLVKGSIFEYSWETGDAELFFDFHGEPEGDTTGYFESFNKSTSNKESGNLTSTFTGTHGWYWKNVTQLPVVITLKINGEYKRIDLNDVLQKNEKFSKPVPATHDSIDSL